MSKFALSRKSPNQSESVFSYSFGSPIQNKLKVNYTLFIQKWGKTQGIKNGFHAKNEPKSSKNEFTLVHTRGLKNVFIYKELKNLYFTRVFTNFEKVLYNKKNKLVLNKDIEIHLLQLPKWQPQQIETEKERWIYLFKEGKNVDVDEPPEVLCTDEMRQAMETLDRFSENEDNYLLYHNRFEATLLENTYINEVARLKKENEQERQEKEQLQAKLDSLLLQLKEKGMDDVVAEIS
ncbi:MAG: hypothetical protein DRQ49_17155 [Gammaproteobacteria bacterium]|nr:MAG: hypothetical protein DRQ49_17155 [Gammaproteobacteria bacterium]RKZ74088.1 MAG: hypothetical protein DRQ57_12305 [Gammaproteobacteria bacterium]